MQYMLYDGAVIDAQTTFAGIENRSFRYGDGFFESISVKQHRALLAKEHAARVEHAAETLKMELPVEWGEEYLTHQIARLLSANGNPVNARCRLVFWRKGGGTYKPNGNEADWVLSMDAVKAERYELGQIAQCGIYKEIPKPINSLSSFKTTSALLYVMASVYMQQHNLEECILLNERGEVCEGSTTNVWIVKDGVIITPSDESGCVQGVLRSHLLQVLPEVFELQATKVIVEDVLNADEIFFTNASGVQAVEQMGSRVYTKKVATQCVAILNESLSL